MTPKIDKSAPNIKNQPILFVDNSNIIKLAKVPILHKRSEPTDMKFNFVREKYLEELLDIKNMNSKGHIADILTKPLLRIQLQKFRSEFGLRCSSRV